ncbi:hypothetical protein PENTCL1PPCAC_22923, partial [Pristionchus entomophagus]
NSVASAMSHRPLCRSSARGLQPEDDSSYESEESHSSLSRQTSGHGILSRNTSMADSMVSSILSTELSSISIDNETKLRRHALTLGYDTNEVEKAMAELGSEVTQESLLSWLLLHSTPSSSSSINEVSPSHSSNLRSIIIDGSNVAMADGRRHFSCGGIRECVSFFEKRGHTDILVFLPSFRRETPRYSMTSIQLRNGDERSHTPMTDQHILEELDERGMIVWTPSRRIDGQRVVCHDDRYILRTAIEKEGIVVSNDEFRELAKEDPSYRTVIEKRLLMYSFVHGRFFPPSDPLGKNGPDLDQYLSKTATTKTNYLCPYLKKCTYGAKCKYLHPERLKLPFASTGEKMEKGNHPVSTRVASDSITPSHLSPLHVMRTNSLDPSIESREKEEKRKVSAIPCHMKHTQLMRNKSAPVECASVPPPSLFTPSNTIWGTCELSVAPITSPESCRNERERLFYHLSNVFPSSSVQTVMESFPEEKDPRKLCESILLLHRRFESPLKSPSVPFHPQ